MDELALLRRKLAREQAARKAAEQILEKKALELFQTNEELKNLNEHLEATVKDRTKALEESERRYRQIVESATDLIFRITPEGFVTYVNPTGHSLLEYQKEEMLGRHFSEFIPPPHFKSLKEFYRQVIRERRTESDYEYPIQTKSGNILWLEQHTQLIFNPDGSVHELSGVARNVTERKQVQEELRRSEDKYRGIIENMELGLMEVDTAQRILRAYPLFCEMTGYKEKELLGKNAIEVFLPQEFNQLMG